MATNNYSISFKSLRTNAVYTLNIGGGSGTAIALKGGAQPFTTEENDDEDQFCPIRTQTGHIRIVDDGKDANGNALSADWWKDLAPINDTERPVTLTGVDANGNSLGTLWQGFMQAQNFSGTLFGNPQEREFPVQCIISVLAAKKVSVSEGRLCNFAYLLRYIFNTLPSDLRPTSYVIQGGAHAQQWLLKRLDWNNFLQEDKDNDVTARYNLYEILEDICRFWGWTIRTHKTTVYMTCTDDTAESNLLVLTPANLDTMADSNTTAGDATAVFSTTTISGDVFASTGNDDFKQRGPGKATVKADVNKQETIIQFAPNSVRKLMENSATPKWSWIQGEEDLTGYFSTGYITSFQSAVLDGTSAGFPRGDFRREQIYSTKETDKPYEGDMFCINNTGVRPVDTVPAISLVTKRAMSFGGGSILIKGDIYESEKLYQYDGYTALEMSIGISPDGDREHAKWWYIYTSGNQILKGWRNDIFIFLGGINGSRLTGCKMGPIDKTIFEGIPVDNDLSGFLHIDFYAILEGIFLRSKDVFQIGNFSVGFSRDTVDIPSTVNTVRPRYQIEERVTTKEYTAENQNQTHEEWNADCIFASDNNMEYGYGLLMNSDGTFMEFAPYAAGNEHPEQHLANRVTNYWAVSRRRLGGDFRVGTIADISPQYKVTIDGTTCHPVAISRDWRDDVVRLSLLEMPTQ